MDVLLKDLCWITVKGKAIIQHARRTR